MASRRYATRNAASRKASTRTYKVSDSVNRFGRMCVKVLAVAFVSACICGVFFVGQVLVKRVNDQQVELVRIEGELKQVSEGLIQQAVSGVAGQSFLSIDLADLKLRLEQTPWIREISVQREWPETLIIHVIEQQAIARWNNAGLLNQYGEVFKPEDVSSLQTLPLLEGPENHETEVMQQYQKFSQVLSPHGLKLSSLSLSTRGAWRMELDNGVKVNFGQADVVERLQRFARILDGNLLNGLQGIDSVDLRYHGGMAVRRRTEIEETMISSL